MMYRINEKTMKAVELKIVSQLSADATIIEYDREPLDENGDILYYGYSIDLNTRVDSTIEVPGEQLDVDHFAKAQDYTVECDVSGTTRESESAIIAVNKNTGEIIIKEIKPAPFTDIANFEIEDAGSLEEASFYIDELKDESNWNDDYKDDLVVKQTSLHVDPATLFED